MDSGGWQATVHVVAKSQTWLKRNRMQCLGWSSHFIFSCTWAGIYTSSSLTLKFWAQSEFKFSSVTQSCPILCNPMDCTMSGPLVHHQLSEFAQIHVHWVGDAIQSFHPLTSSSPPAFNFSQHQGLFQRVSSSQQVAKILEFQLQHQSFQWVFRIDFL